MKKRYLSIFVFLLVTMNCGIGFSDEIDAYPQNSPQGGPPPGEQPPPPPPYERPQPRRPWRERFWGNVGDDDWSRPRLNAKVFYNFAGTGYSYNPSIVNGGFTTPGALSVDMASAAGLSAEVFSARPFGWGYSAGIEYEFSRNINDLNTPFATVIYTNQKPTIQFTTFYANFLIRRWNFYIPLGINYTVPNFSPGTGNGAITNSTFTGNVGYQFAFGILLGDRFSLEFQDHVVHFSGTSTGNTTTINWGDVYLSGLQLNLKFALL